MKKVLIIGHFWPYRGGSGRVLGLAKYLSEFGWNPVVLTGPMRLRPDSKFNFVETDYKGFLGFYSKLLGIRQQEDAGDQLKARFEKIPSKQKRLLKFVYNLAKEIFAYPDEDKNWKKIGVDAAEQFLKKEKVDALISVWPPTAHLIAKKLKNKYKIPWVADFPDPWSQNHNYPYGFVRKYFDERLEIRTIAEADEITVAAPFFKRKQEKLHKRHASLVMLGFDPENLIGRDISLAEKFTITYAGTIYWGKQKPEKFLVSLKNLISVGSVNLEDIKVNFFGPFQKTLEEEIKKHGLERIVSQCGLIPKKEALQKQKESHLLLLLNWEDPKGSPFPLKLFDYLSSQRPIIATGGFHGDDVERVITETGAGVFASESEEIDKAILNFYLSYKKNEEAPFKVGLEKINKYSYREMAKKFADILNRITK